MPEFSGTQQHALEFMQRVVRHGMDQKHHKVYLPFIETIFQGSGISRRYTVLEDYTHLDVERFHFFPKQWSLEPSPSTEARMEVYEKESGILAEQAARQAMEQADIQPEQITNLVFTTCTGFFAPGPDVQLINRLGLSPNVNRTQIGFMGCCAGFNGLQSVESIIARNPDAVVLQIGLELCTLHIQKKPVRDLWVANCLFADGCSAAIFSGQSNKSRSLAQLVGTHSLLAPETLEQMAWKIGNHGFEMRLKPNVPKRLKTVAPDFLQSMLDTFELKRDAIKGWAIHPGGRKIVEALQQAYQLDEEIVSSSYTVLQNYGNVSSATLFFVLKEELHHNANDGYIAALGFGPGLTIEGALFERV